MGTYREMSSSGNTWPQSSLFAEPMLTDPVLKSGISVCDLISALKKKKKAQAGSDWLNILPKSLHARKKPPICVLPFKHFFIVVVCFESFHHHVDYN